jgi:nucleoside-specific channel-forming protein
MNVRVMVNGIILIVLFLHVCADAADYSDGDLRKNDNLWLNLNLYNMHNAANAFGNAYDETYFEIEGGGRSGVLDFYYFFDVNEILGWGDHKDEAGNFFTKIKPRLSLDALTRHDLAIGPVNEWFLATEYRGFNGGEYYYAGVGTTCSIPGFQVFDFNLWPQFLRNSDGADMEYTGLQISLNWVALLFTLPCDSTFTYQGWLDYGFLNRSAKDQDSGTSDEFQMFNGFFLNHGHYSASFSIKFHRHFSYHDTRDANSTAWFLGVHYHL